MSTSNESLCRRAIAYLMPSLPNAEMAVALAELDAPVISNLNNGLLVGYLVDQGNHFQYIQRRHLVGSGMTETVLHQGAVNNLAALLKEKGAKVQPYDDTFAVFFGGNFEASLILVDALWDEYLSHLAPNGFIIAIPNRDILAFCDAQSQPGVEQLRQIIGQVEGGDHPISPTLYRRDRSTRAWRPYAN
ncbi:DUF1444 family protein [Inquilinus sp. CA228]|uniref:DUF1444 family protein n=1 Tax=Inquilinus sp. CA228 TaxID=3455609 RepID=UPI003F8D1AA2